MQHGTLRGYTINACRCTHCTQAKRRYNARRDLLLNTGRWQTLTDAEPVRQHINQLRADGLGWQRIAELATIPTPTVQRLLYGRPSDGKPPTRRLRPDIAVALLAVRADLDTFAPGALIDATGTRRRSQALARLGWSQREQARRLGVHQRNYPTRINNGVHVSAATARAVRALYDELSMAIPPAGQGATYSRRQAIRLGYPPPLAWDDTTIDNPDARPDFGAQPDRITTLLENSDELLAQGYTLEHAAERLGISEDHLRRTRRARRAGQEAA